MNTTKTINLGDKLTYHSDWDGEDNCVLCNKPVGDNALWVCLDVNNRLITADEYNTLTEAACVPVGSTCAKKIAEGVATTW